MTGKTPRRPAPPPGLGPAGRSLWASIIGAYELEPAELKLLELACRQSDVVARLDESVERDGTHVLGSAGQLRLNPAIATATQGRLAIQKLLSGIEMPAQEEEPAKPLSAASRHAQRAAVSRWNKARSHGPAKEA